jgi:hypothetical protein
MRKIKTNAWLLNWYEVIRTITVVVLTVVFTSWLWVEVVATVVVVSKDEFIDKFTLALVVIVSADACLVLVPAGFISVEPVGVAPLVEGPSPVLLVEAVVSDHLFVPTRVCEVEIIRLTPWEFFKNVSVGMKTSLAVVTIAVAAVTVAIAATCSSGDFKLTFAPWEGASASVGIATSLWPAVSEVEVKVAFSEIVFGFGPVKAALDNLFLGNSSIFNVSYLKLAFVTFFKVHFHFHKSYINFNSPLFSRPFCHTLCIFSFFELWVTNCVPRSWIKPCCTWNCRSTKLLQVSCCFLAFQVLFQCEIQTIAYSKQILMRYFGNFLIPARSPPATI